ncbi:MAG: hypothetical protein CBB97_25795 [Candidatus Endolissoclinum sp. TMED37]|nr:MAG: hypothetical protein CBB97_25795 [Candidatus Endolissoclinum sp. TMED37]|tara:strand:+ start:864 stop:1442 length:579 start_codon:yes stop_codon:yes gene_type:complete
MVNTMIQHVEEELAKKNAEIERLAALHRAKKASLDQIRVDVRTKKKEQEELEERLYKEAAESREIAKKHNELQRTLFPLEEQLQTLVRNEKIENLMKEQLSFQEAVKARQEYHAKSAEPELLVGIERPMPMDEATLEVERNRAIRLYEQELKYICGLLVDKKKISDHDKNRATRVIDSWLRNPSVVEMRITG